MCHRDESGHDLQFVDGLRGDVHVTFEEGTWAAWLHDLLKPHVTKVVVCDPRRNALLQEGNQNDRVNARKLAELLHNNQLRSVYHGDHGLRTLKELVRSYLTITQDLSRVMTRMKAMYRSWAIPSSGKQVYAPRHRAEWLGKINEPGVRRRAVFYYQQLDALRRLRQEVRRDLLAESKKHQAWKRLCGIPSRPKPNAFPEGAHSPVPAKNKPALGDGPCASKAVHEQYTKTTTATRILGQRSPPIGGGQSFKETWSL
jgi:hypothetical protein